MNKQGQTQARAGEQGPCEEKALGSKQWEMGRGLRLRGFLRLRVAVEGCVCLGEQKDPREPPCAPCLGRAGTPCSLRADGGSAAALDILGSPCPPASFPGWCLLLKLLGVLGSRILH